MAAPWPGRREPFLRGTDAVPPVRPGRWSRGIVACGVLAFCLTGCGGGGVPDQGASDALRDALASTRTTLAQIGALPAAAAPADDVPAALNPGAAASPRGAATRPAAARRAPDDPARFAAAPGAAAASPRQLPTDLPHQAASLLGLPGVLVTRWLGEPSLRRRDGPAEIWLYQGGACAVDVILYREGARGTAPSVPQAAPDAGAAGAAAEGPLTVAYAAARATGTARRSEAACLREIAEHRAASRAAPPPAIPSGRA